VLNFGYLSLMNLKIHLKPFIYLNIAFFVVVIVETVAHELGHYLVAEMLGYHARLHFGSTTWSRGVLDTEVVKWNHFLITLGGPQLTVTAGTAGLFFLVLYGKAFPQKMPSFKQWALIFTSLFWLRQGSNLMVMILLFIKTGNFKFKSDEIKLTQYLNFPPFTLTLVSSFISLIIFVYVVRTYVPKFLQLTFVAASLIGGISGYVLWLHGFGKYILP
jgi:hypothetical protein